MLTQQFLIQSTTVEIADVPKCKKHAFLTGLCILSIDFAKILRETLQQTYSDKINKQDFTQIPETLEKQRV